MEKVNYKVGDLLKSKLETIKQWYPNVIEINKKSEEAINFDALKIALSLDTIISEDKTERYMMKWPDKNITIINANLPINKVLRPIVEKSVDFFNTKNIYIEGDNLEALKILYNSYINKVNIIYIDPPYNTGNDFIYNDDFTQTESEASFKEGKRDENNNRLVQNLKTDGRFHTNWLNMIYPRLKIARDLLNENGVIFISIDDNEQANLKKICDEIFGQENFVTNLIWQKTTAPKNNSKFISINHDYILMYAKSKNNLKIKLDERSEKTLSEYKNPDNDPRGLWTRIKLRAPKYSELNDYEIEYNGEIIRQEKGYSWIVSKEKLQELINDNRVYLEGKMLRKKAFLTESKPGVTPISLLLKEKVGISQNGTEELRKMFNGENLFDYPKPVKLIKYLINLCENENALVLDFFSGSGTTAHAVLELNNEENLNMQYILIQINENIKEKNIVDLAQSRIKKISENIIDSLNLKKIDLGFRAFRIDTNNIVDHTENIMQINQDLFANLSQKFLTIKDDRNDLDLVFQSILDCRLSLEENITFEKFENINSFYNINKNFMICCFDNDINDINFIKYIANLKPLYVYFKESSFKNDEIKINLEEIFKNNSSDTVIKIF